MSRPHRLPEVDVAIVGGGIQGLVLLRELTAAGYACALVNDGPPGGAQTLHSHGALVPGSGLITGALHATVDGSVVPYVEKLGVAVDAGTPAYLLLPESVRDELAPVWRQHGYAPQLEPSAPAGLEPGTDLYRVPARNVDKRRLVAAVAAGLRNRVLAARIEGADTGLRLRTPSGEAVHLGTRAIVAAAGCDTPRLLTDVLCAGAALAGRITSSKLHMVCLTAPEGVLPAVAGAAAPEMLVVAHRSWDHGPFGRGATLWYATPADRAAVASAGTPDHAVANVSPLLVGTAVRTLRTLVPALRDDHAPVRAMVFAGYKQEIGGQPLARVTELVDPDRNLVVALPSVLANAVPNARDCVALLRDRLEPARGTAAPVGDTAAVAFAAPPEDCIERWQDWGEFVRSYVR